MPTESKNILITGLPGTGKTTLIEKLAAARPALHPVGIYTAEIRENGLRQGFEMVDLAGHRGLLAHTDLPGPPRVGKYGLDIPGFEKFLAQIDFFSADSKLAVVDEIGKMECFSAAFRTLMTELLASPTRLIATIARHGGGFIAAVKKRPDIITYEITPANRDHLYSVILQHLDSVNMQHLE